MGKALRYWLQSNLPDVVAMLWEFLNHDNKFKLPYEEYEKLFLDGWSHAMNNDKEITKGLCPCDNLLHVHGCIQQENVILSINPSKKHNFINIVLAKRL
jgi:hypothetical protein